MKQLSEFTRCRQKGTLTITIPNEISVDSLIENFFKEQTFTKDISKTMGEYGWIVVVTLKNPLIDTGQIFKEIRITGKLTDKEIEDLYDFQTTYFPGEESFVFRHSILRYKDEKSKEKEVKFEINCTYFCDLEEISKLIKCNKKPEQDIFIKPYQLGRDLENLEKILKFLDNGQNLLDKEQLNIKQLTQPLPPKISPNEFANFLLSEDIVNAKKLFKLLSTNLILPKFKENEQELGENMQQLKDLQAHLRDMIAAPPVENFDLRGLIGESTANNYEGSHASTNNEIHGSHF